MRTEGPVWRGILLILLAGVSLGAAYNYAGRLATPPRGLPWIEGGATFAWLESLDPGRAKAGAAPDTASAMTPPSVDGGAGEGGGEALRPGSAAEDSAIRAAGLPVFPDLDQPMDVPVDVVRQFVEAKAALILDARGAAEYESGHLPGARLLGPAEALADPGRLRGLGAGGQPIIAYCSGSDSDAAASLARMLIEAGQRKVLVFRGGWTEWTAAGFAVERGPAPARSSP